MSIRKKKDSSQTTKLDRLPILFRLGVASLVATMFFLGATLFTITFDINWMQCGEGLDSLGCGVWEALVTIFFTYIISVIVGIVALFLLRVKYAFFLGLFAGIVSYVAFNLDRAIAEYLQFPMYGMVFLFYLLGLIISYFIFQIKQPLLVKIGVSVVCLIVFFCGLVTAGVM